MRDITIAKPISAKQTSWSVAAFQVGGALNLGMLMGRQPVRRPGGGNAALGAVCGDRPEQL